MNQSIIERLQDEADLCRNDGAHDIANLLDAAVKEISFMRGWIKQQG